MRRSETAPTKSEPEFAARSPPQPIRSAEDEAAGSMTVADNLSASVPSRKAESEGEAEGAYVRAM